MKVTVETAGVVIVMAVAMATYVDTYPSTWDSIDLETVFSNDRLVTAYVNCLLDRGPCTPDAASLKKVVPEAIRSSCNKCTSKQKDKGAKAIKLLIEKKPELWKEIAKKFDPNGTLTKKFTQ